MSIYIDTNVFVQVAKKERYRGVDHAKVLSLVKRCLLRKVTSAYVLVEVKRCCKEKLPIVKKLIQQLGVNLVPYSKGDEEEAKNLDQDNYTDALHAVLASKYGCAYLLTNNLADFLREPIRSYLKKRNIRPLDVVSLFELCQ